MLLADSLLPKQSARGGFETMGHAGIGDDQKIIAFDNRGRNIGRAPGGPPEDVGAGDVAVAVRFDGKNVVVRVAARDIDQAGLGAVTGEATNCSVGPSMIQ